MWNCFCQARLQDGIVYVVLNLFAFNYNVVSLSLAIHDPFDSERRVVVARGTATTPSLSVRLRLQG
jgi:hypothetical protein